MAGTQDTIREFIDEWLLEEPHPGTDALADRALDSLLLEQLIDYLEETYKILFEDQELARENFGSIPQVAASVDAKVAAR